MNFNTNHSSSPATPATVTAKPLALIFVGAAILLCTLLLVVSSWAGVTAKALRQGVPTLPPIDLLPNGAAAGDVSQSSAVLWARSNFTGTITFTYTNTSTGASLAITRPIVDPTIPVTVTLTGLLPNVRYTYQVASSGGEGATGQFKTAAAVGANPGLRFGATGDWRGELAPYVALRNAPARDLQFLVRLGDTVYADVPSPALPITQATTLADFRLKHDEVYSLRYDKNFWAELQRNTSLYATIDDHEVMNNYAGGAPAASDPRFPETTGLINDTALFANGLRAFAEYNPIRHTFYGTVGGDGRMDNERKFYRYQRYGSDAALFVLDARSFRDAAITPLDTTNLLVDLPRFLSQSFAAGRTLLGTQQLQDLKDDLLDAQEKGIVWKFVALPEPIQLLTPAGGEDRYEGYMAERSNLLAFIADNDISNVVFVAADIHGTIVNNLTYQSALLGATKHTGAFEVTTGSLAYDAPFGPTVVNLAALSGIITPTTKALYDSLPVANDLDGIPNDKDDFVKSYLNSQLAQLAYDQVGLADAAALDDGHAISATLLAGDYMAVHTYGWTEFEIAPATQVLTVTTYGLTPYTAQELGSNPSEVISRTPSIVSQFRVVPQPVMRKLYLPIIAQAGGDTGVGSSYATLANNGNFTILVKALEQTGLDTLLKNSGTVTLFAPTDPAFEALLLQFSLTEEQLLGLPELADVLRYHMLNGLVPSTAITNGLQRTTLQGQRVSFGVNGSAIRINGANVIAADVETSNGIIHVIDAVVIPPVD